MACGPFARSPTSTHDHRNRTADPPMTAASPLLVALLVGYVGFVFGALVLLNVRATRSADHDDPEREILDDDAYERSYEE
jgi:hypothetical protein